MNEDAVNFSKYQYFNGYQNKRSVEENRNTFKTFIISTSEKNIPSKMSGGKSLYLAE
jgi:hypothetical protein